MKEVPVVGFRRAEADLWKTSFWDKVEIGEVSECWPWKGAKNNGYGWSTYEGRSVTAHRHAYFLAVDNPGDMAVHHTCENKICCNPAHLKALTNADHHVLHGEQNRRRSRATKLEDMPAMTNTFLNFPERARELGAISEYEADGEGRIYAVYENGEVLPIGLRVATLAGQSHIAQGGLDQAIREAGA